MDTLTQAEYDRIVNGPHRGWFTFLHHEGPVLEKSDNVMERVEYIITDKSPTEHYDRLRHIYHVGDAKADDYEAKRKLLYDDYWAKLKLLNDGYWAKLKPLDDGYWAKLKLLDDDLLRIIPRCSWNGKTILKAAR